MTTPDHYRPLYESGGTLPFRLEGTDVTGLHGTTYVHHRLVVNEGRPAAVVVAEADGELLLVRIHRRSVGTELWELPRGSSDAADAVSGDQAVDPYSDEALVRAGMRELLEETGYTGEDARVIGRYVADTAVFPQPIGTVHCVVDRHSTPQGTDGEIEATQWFTLDELRAMVAGGQIIDSHTLAALAFWPGVQ
ncbi:MAG: NUDIX hydrolase [Leucobacter sp.]|nr:NUDIX hydrolase [Leucobacter sp.]